MDYIIWKVFVGKFTCLESNLVVLKKCKTEACQITYNEKFGALTC